MNNNLLSKSIGTISLLLVGCGPTNPPYVEVGETDISRQHYGFEIHFESATFEDSYISLNFDLLYNPTEEMRNSVKPTFDDRFDSIESIHIQLFLQIYSWDSNCLCLDVTDYNPIFEINNGTSILLNGMQASINSPIQLAQSRVSNLLEIMIPYDIIDELDPEGLGDGRLSIEEQLTGQQRQFTLNIDGLDFGMFLFPNGEDAQ